MKHLHILLTGSSEHSSAISGAIAKGRPAGLSASGTTAALSRLFCLDGAALAPLLLTAEGIAPGDGHWLRADPVHMLAGMHSVSLLDGRYFTLTAAEAGAMVESLNAHFAGEAEFLAPHPLRWYIRLESDLEVSTPPLDQLGGMSIEPALVTGPDKHNLQRLAMETQMLLHAHPVNEAREQRDELTINGLWFWGSGERRAPATPFNRVLSRNFTTAALASAAAIPCSPPAERLPDVNGETLLELEHPTDDPLLKAILGALRWHRFERVLIESPGSEEPIRQLTPWSLWKP